MVDDSSADRTLCRVLLEEEYGPKLDFLEAPDARRGLEICNDLCDPPPDCLLLDYKLPDMTGVEFLRRLGQRAVRGAGSAHVTDSRPDLQPDLPRFAVVMLTGLGNEQVAVESMKAGAQDYLVKDRITSESLRLTIEKATGKIGLLRALQAERDRLAQLLTEKDALLEEVHHRVKNNLQVIASLLRLQAEAFGGAFGDARLSAALRESQNRVESMALIHQQLYETHNLREVDLAAHAAELANRLMHAHGIDPARVHCRVQMEELRLPVDRAIPAALILNELLSNAMKHAFADGRPGTIEVKGEVTGGQRDGDVVIEVRDDGRGLPSGAGSQPPHRLGLYIVGILTRQLRGAFVIENGRSAENGPGENGPGAVCRLKFPGEGGSYAKRTIVQGAAG